MRIAIVDDEEIWRGAVEEKIKQHPWKGDVTIDIYTCGEEFYNQKGYDVVFLDIEMKDMDGFETAYKYKENNEDSIIIFLTTHTELSRRGYLVNAFRYIDKMSMQEELQEAFHAIEDLQSRNHVITVHELHMGEVELPVKSILFIETDKRNVIIHTDKQEHVSNSKIDELEEALREWGFFRCHKSFLVNLENIDKFDKIYVHFRNGSKAMVSTRKYTELKDKYIEHKFRYANS